MALATDGRPCSTLVPEVCPVHSRRPRGLRQNVCMKMATRPVRDPSGAVPNTLKPAWRQGRALGERYIIPASIVALVTASLIGLCSNTLSAQTANAVILSGGLIGESFVRQGAVAGERNSVGLLAQLDLPGGPHVSIETRLLVFPRSELPTFEDQGGRTAEGTVGLRLDSGERRVQFSAATGVGIRHLTNTYTDVSVGSTPGPWSTLVFTSDLALTVRLGATSFARIGCEVFVSPEGGQEVHLGGAISQEVPAVNNHGLRCDAALGHGFGRTRQRDYPPEDSRRNSRRWTIDIGATRSEYATSFGDPSLQRKNGAFALATFALRPWCDIEGVARLFRSTDVPTPYEGGALAQGMFGVRSGIRQRHFGEFVLFRIGADSWAKVNTSVAGIPTQPSTWIFSYKRLSDPALEFGAAVDTVLTNRLTIRAELIDHLAFNGSTSFVEFGNPPLLMPATANHSLGIELGLGVAFGSR